MFHEVGVQAEQAEKQMMLAMESGDNGDENGGGEGQITTSGEDNVQMNMPVPPPSSMVQKTLADACLVVEALGPK